VGFRKDLGIDKFTYPKPKENHLTINDIIEEKPVSVKYYLSDVYLESLRKHKKRHKDKGNGFGFEIISKIL
jgi:DNA (cytosine-5)-methyltransferase 1